MRHSDSCSQYGFLSGYELFLKNYFEIFVDLQSFSFCLPNENLAVNTKNGKPKVL
jgi:hypothetical protein